MQKYKSIAILFILLACSCTSPTASSQSTADASNINLSEGQSADSTLAFPEQTVPIRQSTKTLEITPVQVTTKQTVQPDPNIEPIRGVALAPNGKSLAIITFMGLYLYDSDSFQKLWFQPLQQQSWDLKWDLKFSPDGQWLALAGSPNQFEVGQAEIRLVQNGTLVRVLSPSSLWRSINWSPDGTTILTASRDGEIIQWQFETGKPLLEIQPAFSCYRESCFQMDAVWSSDGDRIISSCMDGTLTIRNAHDGDTIFTLTRTDLGGLFPGYSVASPIIGDNRLAVAAGNFERSAIVIDGKTGMLISTVEIQFGPTKMAWSPDGKTLAVGETAANAVELIDLGTYKVRNAIYIDSREGVFWSPDGQILYLAGSAGVSAVNPVNGQVLRTLSIRSEQ